MKTGDIVGWVVVNRFKKNCSLEPSRSSARWVARLLNKEPGTYNKYGPFRVCKIEVVR